MDFTQVVEVETRESPANTNIIDSGDPSVTARDQQPSSSPRSPSVGARDQQPSSSPLFVTPAASVSRHSPHTTSTALQSTVVLVSQAPEIQRLTGHNASLEISNVPDSTSMPHSLPGSRIN
jgi:hypothetical protein